MGAAKKSGLTTAGDGNHHLEEITSSSQADEKSTASLFLVRSCYIHAALLRADYAYLSGRSHR